MIFFGEKKQNKKTNFLFHHLPNFWVKQGGILNLRKISKYHYRGERLPSKSGHSIHGPFSSGSPYLAVGYSSNIVTDAA